MAHWDFLDFSGQVMMAVPDRVDGAVFGERVFPITVIGEICFMVVCIGFFGIAIVKAYRNIATPNLDSNKTSKKLPPTKNNLKNNTKTLAPTNPNPSSPNQP